MRACCKTITRCESRLINLLSASTLPRQSCSVLSVTRHPKGNHQGYRALFDCWRQTPRFERRLYSVLQSHETTIYALSTAPGRAAIAIIRISGLACLSVYHGFCPDKPPPRPRHATLRTLYEPCGSKSDLHVLDAGALVLYFPAPETATGEDILEFHVHGGTAVVKAVLAAIPRAVLPANKSLHEIRYAEPGEFTKRAFYNNRLDLTQVEALGDTLSAETEQQRRLAIRGSTGVLADRYGAWRHKLLHARGELEALIDFSEDQHFDESPAKLCKSVAKQVKELWEQLQANIDSASRGELLRNGISIALVGAPNAGKSSLLNLIVGREAAIVNEQAGTTRDVVDVSVDLGGYLCRFGDLAGLRTKSESAHGDLNSIEKEGIRRARERALKADVIIVFLSVQNTARTESNPKLGLEDVYLGAEVEATLAQLQPESQKVVCVLGKADLFPKGSASISDICAYFSQHPSLRRFSRDAGLPIFPISCKSIDGTAFPPSHTNGIQNLLNGLTGLFDTMTEAIVPSSAASTGNNAAWTESLGASERQRVLLQQCLQHLDGFLAQVDLDGQGQGDIEILSTDDNDDVDVVLAAESLRSAADCLARITGKGEAGDVEEVLGVVFEKFCVGK